MNLEREKTNSQMRIRPMIESDDEIDPELSEDETTFNELYRNMNPALNSRMEEDKNSELNKSGRTVKIQDMDKENSVISNSTVNNNSRPQTYPVHNHTIK